MKEIKLTKGKVALVDDQDYDNLNKYRWQANSPKPGKWYAVRRYKNEYGFWKSTSMHRQILGITDPKITGDHQDGDGLNNQRNNLRIATYSQNGMNSNGGTGLCKIKGVTRHTQTGRYWARITINGMTISLGLFDTPEEAGEAYNQSARAYFKEYAKLNP